MRVERVGDYFTSLLTEAGVDLRRPDVLGTWQVFKALLATEVEHTHGGCLFECGLYEEDYEVHFLRFFYFEETAGWDDLMINCTFKFRSHPDLNRHQFSRDADCEKVCASVDFITRIEAEKDFWQALARHRAYDASVDIGPQ